MKPWLKISDNSRITILTNPKRHVHALRQLKHYLPNCQFQIIDIKESAGVKNDCALKVWLIDFTSEVIPPLTTPKEISGLVEGGFIVRSNYLQENPEILIAGGDLAGAIYAVNELGLNHIKLSDKTLQIPELDIAQAPALPHRFFWTWDHSTNWHLNQNGFQEIGFANPYMKPADGFLKDYCKLIDFMSLNRLNGITIYGFLRDSHGGIEAAQELCRYANERGVRILPGVGINCYGGIYWEGEHKYNLSTWLKKHPELRAQFNQPKEFTLPEFAKLHLHETSYLDAACPSKPQNIDYHVEAIQWLTETFEIGGINFETGDYGTCQCAQCSARRSTDAQWSIKDMADVYPRLFTAARNIRPDMWLVCEAYWDNMLDLKALAPLAELPNDAIYQFCINRSYWKKLKSELSPEHVKLLPRSTNIVRTHMGSQWQHERYELVAPQFADMMSLSRTTGLRGANIFGEASAFNTVNEINYMAFARFAYDANLTWQEFVNKDLSALLGGADAAKLYLDLLTVENSRTKLQRAIEEAREVAKDQTGQTHQRWTWLQNRLYQKLDSAL
ncbi:MAG TPA: hypothetical protein VKR58_07355 [Aquella sp.]|nr:hypothetical protein [Aquella sp.]